MDLRGQTEMSVLFPGGAIKASVAAQYSGQIRGDVAARYSRSVLPLGSAQARASERTNLGGIAGNPVPCYGAGFFIFRILPQDKRRTIMKKTSFAKLIGAAMALTMALTGCASGNNSDSAADSSSSADSANTSVSADAKKIGVLQYAAHPSLDNCYEGIRQGLVEAYGEDGVVIDLQNGQGDGAACDSIAANFVSKGYDMIYAIATPAALSAYSAASKSDIPMVFCAVSDPVAAGLTESLDAGIENCNGTSDILDFSAQVELIQAIQPDVKKIGVLYTNTEANSLSQLKSFKAVCEGKGIEVVESGVNSAADIPQAATTLASQVDCINNFTDNNVVNNLSVVLEKADAAGIPVYGSEVEQVKNGCLASISIDYIALGKKTAEMGVEILNGTDPKTMAVGTISEGTPVINSEVMEKFGFAVPESYANAEMVTTNSDAEAA